MRGLRIELRKEKRSGVVPVLLLTGILGALYAFANFVLRKDALLGLPMDPMSVLLTQLYGMIMVLNMFGIVVASCVIYNMEFRGNAIKKMYMLPMSIPSMYFCKFIVITGTLFMAIVIQSIALVWIGITDLPKDSFKIGVLIAFAGYSFITSMPVAAFMLLISSRFQNMWVPLGIGVAGFLSGMALAVSNKLAFVLHPFVMMLKPAVAMNAKPEIKIVVAAILETLIFLGIGLWLAKKVHYE